MRGEYAENLRKDAENLRSFRGIRGDLAPHFRGAFFMSTFASLFGDQTIPPSSVCI